MVEKVKEEAAAEEKTTVEVKGDNLVFKFDEETIAEIAREAFIEAKKDLIKKEASSVSWRLNSALETEIARVVKDFVDLEVAPVAREMLLQNKQQISEAVAAGTLEITKVLMASAISTLQENLKSYKRREIMKALFE